MLLYNDKYYSAPRLGKLQELMHIEGSLPGIIIRDITLLFRMLLALSTQGQDAGGNSVLPRCIPVLYNTGIVCKTENL